MLIQVIIQTLRRRICVGLKWLKVIGSTAIKYFLFPIRLWACAEDKVGGGDEVCAETAFSHSQTCKHFRAFENLWTGVLCTDSSSSSTHVFSSPVMVYLRLPACVNVLVSVSMATKRGVEYREASLWSPALSRSLPAATASLSMALHCRRYNLLTSLIRANRRSP